MLFVLEKSKNSFSLKRPNNRMNPNNLELHQHGKKTRELTDLERVGVVSMLLGMEADGKLPESSFIIVASKFKCSSSTVSRLWARAKFSRLGGEVDVGEIISKKHLTGRKKKWDDEAMQEAIKDIPLKNRRTVRALSKSLGVPTTTLQRRKKKVFVQHKSSLKPMLTDEHRVARIEYCLWNRDATGMRYNDMYNCVHVDEKWFYMQEDNTCFLVAPDEKLPYRVTRHKGYIKKVMFLSAIARPRMIDGNMWDGKIGIWPIGGMVLAKRASKNRPKGCPVWDSKSVDKSTYREYMIDKVLPAIIAKFPASFLEKRNGKGVLVQQDGASSHIKSDDVEWLAAVAATGKSITLYNQPANSPDTNINDLAFFRSIQTLYYDETPTNEWELIAAVQRAYDAYSATQLNKMWVTHQTCMNETLKDNGGNAYNIPHMNKKKLQENKRLPNVINVCKEVDRFDDRVL